MPEYQQPAALVFLVLTAPLIFYICWSDLRRMKIPTWSTDLLMAIFAIAGLIVLPFEVWAWRWLNAAVVLAVMLALMSLIKLGGGDAKLAVSAAPFIDPQHTTIMLYLVFAFTLGAFVTHRSLRAVPSIRRMAPDWVSWTRADFPAGIALGGAFLAYLWLMAFPGLMVDATSALPPPS